MAPQPQLPRSSYVVPVLEAVRSDMLVTVTYIEEQPVGTPGKGRRERVRRVLLVVTTQDILLWVDMLEQLIGMHEQQYA
jgi:hypothetical protein